MLPTMRSWQCLRPRTWLRRGSGLLVALSVPVYAASIGPVLTPDVSATTTLTALHQDHGAISRLFNPTSPGFDERSISDLLTNLLDVDALRVSADTHRWNCPDTVSLQHHFLRNVGFSPYLAVGMNRSTYLDDAALKPVLGRLARSRRSFGPMAEAGLSWTVTRDLDLSLDVHWLDLNGSAAVLRTDTGPIAADRVALTLGFAWRRH